MNTSSTYLEKLLGGAKVEWQPLRRIASVGTGSSNRQDECVVGIYPFYVRSRNILKAKNFEFDEEAIIIPGEGGIGDIFHYAKGKYALHQRAYRIAVTSEILATKFLYYFMCSKFKHYILQKSVGTTSISIRKPMLESFFVPIPPLHVQQEIVRILDKFTELTTELTTELSLRKKQYNYYREKLLEFPQDKGVEWKTLGDVGEFIRGNGLQKNDFVEAGFPAIHYGQIYTRYGLSATKTFTYISEKLAEKLRKAQKNDLLLTTTSENDKDVAKPLAWLGEQAAISGHMMIFRHQLNVKYLAYFFQTETFQFQKRKYIRGTKVSEVSSHDLAKIKIPIPSLQEQERIVAILDKFETLTHSLSEGLPREIILRQKHYEYSQT